MLKYYLLKMLRNKSFLFWNFMFPVSLMICFHVAFGNLYEVENNFDSVKAVYVLEDEPDLVALLTDVLTENGMAFILENEEMQQFLTIAGSGNYDELENIYSGYTEEELQAHFEAIFREIETALRENGTLEELAEKYENVDWENEDNPLGVVLSEEQMESVESLLYNLIFEMAMEMMSDEQVETQCFDICKAETAEEARAMVDNGEKTVIFYVGQKDIRVELAEEHSSEDLIIVNSFVSSFKTQYEVIKKQMLYEAENRTGESGEETAICWFGDWSENEETMADMEQMTIAKAKADIFNEEPNPYNWYYYATVVMGIMFNILTGINIIEDTQADVSKGAMRVSVTPEKKTSILIQSFLAKFIVAYVLTSLQLVIMNYVFQIPVGNRIGQLMLFVAVANLFALSMGEFLGLFLRGKINERQNKANALLMVSVFLSGEMLCQLPGILQVKAPIVNEINPATILNFALYKLVYYENLDGFYYNILKIFIVTIVLLGISILKMRRQKYASV
ncbi:MAG: ABC transporter permease [Lachnospiraceae bacterium]